MSSPAGNPRAGGRAPPYARLAAGVFLLLLVVSLAAGFAAYRRLVHNQEVRNEEILARVAETESTALSNWVSERLADALVFSSGRFLGETMHEWIARGAPDDLARQRMQEQLRAVKATYSYLEAAIHDVDGSVRITTDERIEAPDSATAETVQRALDSNTTEISGIHLSLHRGAPVTVVDIATPLLDTAAGSEQMRSVLVLRANAAFHFSPLADPSAQLASSTAALLVEIRDGNAVVAGAGGPLQFFQPNDILPLKPEDLRALAAGRSRQFTMRTDDGAELYAVTRKVAGVPWYLVTAVDSATVRAGTSRIGWSIGAIWLASLALLGTVLLLWWRQKDARYRLSALQAASEHRALRRRYDFLSRYANDMILLADDARRTVEANDRACEMLGRRRAEILGTPLAALFPAVGREALDKALDGLQPGGTAMFELDLRRGSAPRELDVSARAINMDGRQIIQLICRDITERKQAEAALRASEERLNGILASIVDVVWSFSPDLSRLNYINASVEQVFGLPPAAFLERPQLWLESVFPEDRPDVEARLRGLCPENQTCDSEYRIRRGDGRVRWLHCRGRMVYDENGRPLRFDGVSTDVTVRKCAEQQVQTLAYYDSVTSLPNRQLLNDRLAQALPVAQRVGTRVALLFMDLDNFKNINDSLGHHVGDLLLREIAQRLKDCVREEDTVARIGGDEFLVVLPDLERGGQAANVAEKILAATARPYRLQDNEIHTTISIGISVFPDDAKEAAELIRHADSAMYEAKSHGRANFQFFTEELNFQITRSTEIERQLRHALDSGELSLWYQPQIDARSGLVIGAEALLRWQRPDGRFLSPLEFIPVAEERGLINRIGEWAMREACGQCRSWQLQGLRPVPVAVNVSPIQFQQKGFASQVTDILAETRLDATLLELEITESAIMRRAPLVAELAMRLREVGVGISIDDFGTGYSSLSYLKQIPIDKIKIDRSFIADMLVDDDDDAITNAIVNLAHSLKLRVIAEGVESHAQIERLRSFGCDEVQGHYFSAAVPAAAFRGFLADGRLLQGSRAY
ncbi:MAG TPA: EAL domain-containing protein [Noviherbaspirillum sp.]|uniref:bifunctional diguanylate cyclase/phosphodiesterase n=1 Tax=Noviherbaspirillum sp. TaxID=1926288 RepID=UPI002F924CC4